VALRGASSPSAQLATGTERIRPTGENNVHTQASASLAAAGVVGVPRAPRHSDADPSTVSVTSLRGNGLSLRRALPVPQPRPTPRVREDSQILLMLLCRELRTVSRMFWNCLGRPAILKA